MPDPQATTPFRKAAGAAAALAVAIGLACTALPAAASTPRLLGHFRQPSDEQLQRLAEYERYIEYFTSLAYGPTGSMVSAEYIRALILTESAAYERACSNKGARGLTQIMPDTGRLAVQDIVSSGLDYEYVDEKRLARYSPEVLYDPATNILIACYLGALYHTDYRGRTDLVAAAWNAGPQAVARYGYRTPPYDETRGMVLRLVGFLNYFSSTSSPADRPRIVPAPASRFRDLSHPRWDAQGWNQPGWDEKKVNWEADF